MDNAAPVATFADLRHYYKAKKLMELQSKVDHNLFDLPIDYNFILEHLGLEDAVEATSVDARMERICFAFCFELSKLASKVYKVQFEDDRYDVLLSDLKSHFKIPTRPKDEIFEMSLELACSSKAKGMHPAYVLYWASKPNKHVPQYRPKHLCNQVSALECLYSYNKLDFSFSGIWPAQLKAQQIFRRLLLSRKLV